MMELEIFQAIKLWIKLYGICILDLLLEIKDSTSTDNLIRYGMTENEFADAFMKHISLIEYYQEQVGFEYPYLGIKIDQLTDSNQCYQMYRITFVSEFSTVSPGKYPCIGNEPEDILEYYQDLKCCLDNMMYNITDDLYDNTDIPIPNIVIAKDSIDPIRVNEEILARNFNFDADILTCK